MTFRITMATSTTVLIAALWLLAVVLVRVQMSKPEWQPRMLDWSGLASAGAATGR